MNILVLCTGNSARSILLESILNDLGKGRVRAYSAGSQPAGRVHPQSIALLGEKGMDVSDARSKSWDEFALPDAPVMDAVITVCGSAAGETCPMWPGAPLRAHWGVEDPAAAQGDAITGAFSEAYEILHRRAAAFLAEPVEQMDTATLRAHLNACALIL
ncbi:arsenate reductase ArsC [Sulfitobacter mediterraneus]|uniref:Protein-tyrosine-phosphatase n=1 Tax=Sulfitobacter mediterraneus TaxID=83219 RepID=A0A2T6CDB3_9RHOB|nr:arsenate reductase ArsC [Sulfitobacter mediterraneus]KIN79525.1 Low molecular weight phosphotyrosine protein phosphatase [Sulfitobacter mediterraneus KCTC 32188]PTX73484.1 protein-tyrosine-phosphatase [Sulfitobacter mediterraneus]